MDTNSIFSYTYSAPQNQEVENIRKKYLPKEESKLDELKRLDRQVQQAGIAESLCLGIIGCLIFGVGMCMGLEAIPGGMVLAVIFGIIGTAIMIPAYSVCRRKERKVREQLTPRILALAEELAAN